jgi:hypothetical protein
MPIYTVVLDYKGGTYISQIKARTHKEACLKWADQLDPKVIFGMGSVGKASLQTGIAREEPVLIQGLKNVWCQSALVRGKGALINIIQTEI